MGSMNNLDCHDVCAVCNVYLIERVSEENSKPVISFFFEMGIKTTLQWLLLLHYPQQQCAHLCAHWCYLLLFVI